MQQEIFADGISAVHVTGNLGRQGPGRTRN